MKKIACSFIFFLVLLLVFSTSIEAESGLLSEGPPVYGNPYTGEIIFATNNNIKIPGGYRYVMNSPSVYFVDTHPNMMPFPDGNYWWIEKRDLGLNTGVSWLRLLYVVDKNLTSTYTYRIVGAIVNGKVATLANDDQATIACQYLRDSKDPRSKDLGSPVDLSLIVAALNNAHLGIKKGNNVPITWASLKTKGASK